MASTCSDTFNFSAHNLFKSIKDFLPTEKDSTQEILDCKDDILYVWNSKDSNLLSLNWRAAKVKGFDVIKYQTLLLSSTQNFSVNKILVSNDSQFIAVAGSRGVSLVELPRRWGANGQYNDGKDNIICHSHSLDEHFFNNNSHLEVLQIRWHPGSPTDTHLLVLLSDNSIRVYDESSVKHIWRVGPLPSMTALEKNSSFLSSLGDIAVDFDVAPPRVFTELPDFINESINNLSLMNSTVNSTLSKTKAPEQKKVEWPIMILRGDGSIYALRAGLDTDKPPLEGPLTMFPQKQDNYGLDSCSMIVIPTQPPTLVIAENSGRIHHALMVESDLNEFDETKTMIPCEWDLHVLETIELELGLPEKNSKKDASCPIHLKRDIINEHRYFCYHNTGLHAITLGFAQQLQEFIDGSNANEPNFNEKSRAEYILCTAAFATDKINAIMGFTLLQAPSGLLLILGSGQIISLDLIIDRSLIPSIDVQRYTNESDEYPAKKLLKGSFDQHIRNILKTDLSQPILKLDKSSPPTPQQAFELLINATQVLKEKYFVKHEKAAREIENRVKILKILKQQQLEEISELQRNKEEIQDKATQLAEMHEDISEKQRSLFRRVQEVVRLATLRLPGNSSEKEFTQQIQKINTVTKMFLSNLEKVKTKISSQEAQFEEWNRTNTDSSKVLSVKREKTIHETIAEMSSQIEAQISDIKKIKECLNV